MKTTISSKGQLVLPAEFREQDCIVTGQQFEVERIEAGHYLLRRTIEPGQPGLLNWLRDCPNADWFEPVSSETTDKL